MEARAVRRYIRSSPRKVRIVVDQVRGKPVPEALNILHFLPHRASKPVESTLQSAVYNLMERFSDERLNETEMIVKEIFVDEAPTFKRIRPAPRGRAHRIRKRTSHLTVVVGMKGEVEEVVGEDAVEATTERAKRG